MNNIKVTEISKCNLLVIVNIWFFHKSFFKETLWNLEYLKLCSYKQKY